MEKECIVVNTLCVTEREQKQAAQIRRQYRGPQADKMAQLKKLDGKVKRPGKWAALFLGAAGSLVMGAGMSLVMVWQNMQQGIALGIPGLLLMLLAYPVYGWITGRRKRKYAEQVLRLSGEVLAGSSQANQ